MTTKILTMLAVGDIMLSTPAEPLLASVAPTLRSAEVVVGQGETVFTLRGVPTYVNLAPPVGAVEMVVGQGETVFHTRGVPTRVSMPSGGARGNDPSNISALAAAGFNVIHLAGNHIWDEGVPGVEDTTKGLRKHGIAFTGAGMNIDEARRPAVIERDGTRFGFLSYNCVGPIGSWATPNKPGCAYVHIITAYEQYELAGGYPTIYTFAEPLSLQAVVDDIHKLRPLCDVLVVHLHKGVAFIPVILARYEQQVSYAAIDAGADLVVGDHAHMLKGIEQYRGKWIFHSLGDFVRRYFHRNPQELQRFTRDLGGPFFFGPEHRAVPFPYSPEGMMKIIAKCTIDNGQISEVSYLPCLPNEQDQTEILKHDKRGQQVFDYMDNITKGAGLNARYEWKGDEVVIHT